MERVEVTIPSKMISFGNVKPFIVVKDPTDLAEVAAAYLEAVAAYQAAEQGYVAAKLDGAEADAKAPAYEAPDDNPVDQDTADYAAAAMLAEGLGGVTVVEDEEAPWNKAPAESTAESNAWDAAPEFGSFDWS